MHDDGPAHDISGPAIEIEQRDAHLVATIDGTVIADSQRPSVVRQTDSGVARYYVPAEDVRLDLLERSATTTHCPHKGDATHHSARISGVLHEDVAWSYEDPLPAAAAVAGWISFYDDRVRVVIGPQPA